MLQHPQDKLIRQTPATRGNHCTAEPPTLQPNSSHFLGSIRIDLVEASLLELSLHQACALSVIHHLINNRLVPYSDIENNRWWFIDGCTLNSFAESAASHPSAGTQYLSALQDKGLVVIDEVDTDSGIKAVLRVKNQAIFMTDDTGS